MNVQIQSRQPGQGTATPNPRDWLISGSFIAVLCLLGWLYLAAMIVDMIPSMDMTEAGPGMGVFNQFNFFRGLSDEARAALAVLCLPAGATFGMPSVDMSWADLLKIFVMWTMMALAMMLPSAVPMFRAYHAHIGTTLSPGASVAGGIAMVVLGYLAVWTGYAVVATAAQWVLSALGSLTDMMAPASMALTTSVLLAAGIYQFTPAKQACLERCWYPRWSFAPGSSKTGAFREGVLQGLICLGCCWAVMTVMFAVGLMNIVWIALLGAVMAIEKTFPNPFLPKFIGLFLLSWGGFLAYGILSGGLAA